MFIAIHQPNYIPWIGYFSKIKSSDHFVFLDDAQYSKNNYINRVKVLSPSGFGKWITIPVSYQYTDLIREVVAVDGWTGWVVVVVVDVCVHGWIHVVGGGG